EFREDALHLGFRHVNYPRRNDPHTAPLDRRVVLLAVWAEHERPVALTLVHPHAAHRRHAGIIDPVEVGHVENRHGLLWFLWPVHNVVEHHDPAIAVA